MTLSSFRFATAGEIRFGRGVATGAVRDLAGMHERTMLVTGADSARADWLLCGLKEAGIAVTIFPIPGEPTLAMIEDGIARGREADAGAVIAVGGGAAIDAGKAIAALVPATRPVTDHLEIVGKGLPLDAAALPCAALPTTAGTGAEVTRNAVIAVPEHHRKVSLRDSRILPRLAIVDPLLTDSCPRKITLTSGLDAVTQVIEPYISTRANPMTDALCRAAIPAGLAALAALMTDPDDTDARDRMAWVSLCVGLALANAGLGVVHGLAGPLGGLSGAAHGAICGALLPHGLAANAAACSDRAVMARIGEIETWIAAALGGPKAAALTTLADWSCTAGLPGLDALGITAGARAAAADAAAASSSMKANPAALDKAQLSAIMALAR